MKTSEKPRLGGVKNVAIFWVTPGQVRGILVIEVRMYAQKWSQKSVKSTVISYVSYL